MYNKSGISLPGSGWSVVTTNLKFALRYVSIIRTMASWLVHLTWILKKTELVLELCQLYFFIIWTPHRYACIHVIPCLLAVLILIIIFLMLILMLLYFKTVYMYAGTHANLYIRIMSFCCINYVWQMRSDVLLCTIYPKQIYVV